MPRRRRFGVNRENRHRAVTNGLGCLAACLACTLGIIMLILGHTRGDKCKMRAIDVSSWADPKIDGNLIKWFKYTGALFLIAGCWANCTIGACPCHILEGIFGKIVLFLMYLITLLCNLLGFFWLFMASKARNPENSSNKMDINYCAPEIWITANVVVNIFWIVSGFGVLVVCAQLHRFFRSEEARRQPVILGKKKEDAKKTTTTKKQHHSSATANMA
jgi:hypothetical protein